MKIKIDDIKELDPCKDGLDNLIKYYPNFNYTIKEFLKLEHIPYDDKIWLATKMIDITVLNQWSLDCAIFVVDNYNKEYPNDNRINECLEMTKLYLLGECTLEELSEARSAAWSAARSAAWSAAWSARSAAKSAAESAAGSAAGSAESAARLAARSASSAAWSAAESEQEDINLSLLIALL